MSRCRNGIGSHPRRTSPKKTMPAPATRFSPSRWADKKRPTTPAEAPSDMKRTENPSTKRTALRRIVRQCQVLSSCNCSALRPVIVPTNPGTSGNTQGDKKEIIPARNAAVYVSSTSFPVDSTFGGLAIGSGKKFLDLFRKLAAIQKPGTIKSFALVHPIGRSRSTVLPANVRAEGKVHIPGRRMERNIQNCRVLFP